MDNLKSTLARQLAQGAIVFEQQKTGRVPKAVSVVLDKETLVIRLHETLASGEGVGQESGSRRTDARIASSAFANSSDSLRQEIKRITGVEVRESSAQLEMITGAVTQMFASGIVVQVFLLARSVPADTWSGSVPGDPA